nr:sigma-70 family RNA polymerase sigma factor [Agrobacterium vitis]
MSSDNLAHLHHASSPRPENQRETCGEVVSLIPALRAFARTFHTRTEDADDLVQETLMRALANLDKFQSGTRLKSWLFTIMRNTFCTRANKGKREIVGLEPAISATLVSEPRQDLRARLSEVERAMSRLPSHQREILTLIVLLGESYEDAAQICGCAVGTVKSRLNRARQQLYRELGEA